jgi:3-hydroxyisobutyrate dehydrogenase-like beta-hydroxyacid dehydrogenase
VSGGAAEPDRPEGTGVGLLGLGIMGSAMSGHLLERGFDVIGYDPLPDRAAALRAAGGRDVASVADVARAVDVAITSLPTAEAAVAVCAEIAGQARPGLVVVETSTLPMDVKATCRARLGDAGVTLLDCPLSGTGAQALTRDVVVYGSGAPEAFESVRPVLDAFSRSVRYLGAFGHGSVMKYIANLLVAVHNIATAEAFALGIRAGLDREQIWETVRDGAGGSVIFDKRGKLMIDERYLPATAKISMFVKDVGIVRAFADGLDLPTPVLDATVDLYDRAVAAGLADADAAAVLSLMQDDHREPIEEPS